MKFFSPHPNTNTNHKDIMKPSKLIPILASWALFSACDSSDPSASKPAASAEPSEALKAVFVDQIADEAEAIHLVRTTAKPGDTVVLNGMVMGAKEPFVEGRAAFILGDREKLTPCNERPDDPCSTPWDVCCDSKENRRVGTAMVQISGDDGRPLKESLEGVLGMKKLSKIRVKGRVAETSGPDNLVIHAEAIEVLE